jgi:hypothetical protein
MRVLWHLKTQVLLRVLDVEKIEGDYLVHLCDASEGSKEDLLMYYTCMLWIFGGATRFSGERFLSRRSW